MFAVSRRPAHPKGQIIGKPENKADKEQWEPEDLRDHNRADTDTKKVNHGKIFKIPDGPVELPAIGEVWGHGITLEF
jgi:hypothetical protein